MATDADYLQRQALSVLDLHNIDASRLETTLQGAANGFVARLTSQEADKLSADANVQFVEPDRIVKLGTGCFTLVSPSTAQWGVKRTGVGDGSGKTVWIIDTGVDFDHPDLIVDKTRSKNFINPQGLATDDNGHGTHVAGIIAAVNNNIGVLGVAPGAKIVALKVLGNTGEGNSSYIFQALNYISQQAAAGDVVNMSLGADTISVALDNTVKNIAARGILFSIAAGNSSEAANLTSPARANAPNIFTVSAIDSMGRYASFSNFGNDVVDYAAPGVNIVSTFSNGRYARLSGTSMAAPHMAGILLLNGTAVRTKGTALNDPDGTPDKIASVN
ncbi:MAG: S8 family peptidase [Sphingobacteriales bacterium]|nr:MAG: S8 family peptidase [Sphingobacteriales bacterium]